MALFVTPRQFRQRAEFYRQLGQLTAAGMGLVKALEIQQRDPPHPSYRQPIRQMLTLMAQGSTFADSLRSTGRWLPDFDQALLDAGEHSGRLDACFKLLADYYDDRARMARAVIADLWYPVLLIHMAAVIFPFVNFVKSGSLLSFGFQVCAILLPLYVLAVVGIYAFQARRGESWRAFLEELLYPVPVVGTARHYLALGRLAAALEALLSAGVTMIEAWNLAAAASGSPALRRTVRSWKPQLAAGQTPAELVSASRIFPEAFANLYSSGEVSGKLDESLHGLHEYYQENGSHKMHMVAQWVPRFIYLIIAAGIGYKVIMFWAGYFQQIGNAGRF